MGQQDYHQSAGIKLLARGMAGVEQPDTDCSSHVQLQITDIIKS